MSSTSRETISFQKLYCCFEVFFLLRIFLRTLDMAVIEESSFGLSFSKKHLADLKMSLRLLECFAFVWFYTFYLLNILKNVLIQQGFPYTGGKGFSPYPLKLFGKLCPPSFQSLNQSFISKQRTISM